MLTAAKTTTMTEHRLTRQEFDKVAEIVYGNCGINLELCKKTMVESRLGRRLRALNLPTFHNYLQYVTSKDGIENELVHMIDVLTTNKTDFFRENHHFKFLTESVLPNFFESSPTRS